MKSGNKEAWLLWSYFLRVITSVEVSSHYHSANKEVQGTILVR